MIIIRQRGGIQTSIPFSSPLTKLLTRGNGEVSHYLAEFKLLKRLLSPNLCIRHHKEVNKLLCGFLLKGNEKMKRIALINDIEDGGLKMLDIQSMILSQRVIAFI